MSAGIAAAVLAIAAAVGIAFTGFFSPKPPPEQVIPSDGYDRAAMDALMAPSAVAAVHSDIVSFGYQPVIKDWEDPTCTSTAKAG
jgi:H+/gluconate symporter-like permease